MIISLCGMHFSHMRKDNNMNIIQINAAIFPKVIQIIMGKPQPQQVHEDDTDPQHIEPDLIIDLPRSAYLTYLQNMASEGPSTELELLKKYANGISFSDSEFEEAIKLILFTGGRNHRLPTTDDILEPFGICIDRNGEKRKLNVINSEKNRLRAETWEYILIDILKKSAFDIIECFGFESSFTRVHENNSDSTDLKYSLMSWKFSFDEAEQSLSNVLRSAFIFTLIGYCFGDNKNIYANFQDYFDTEYYKRVSLIYGTWTHRGSSHTIQYLPLYDSFHNLKGLDKSDLIDILKAILDDPEIALDEKQTLKDRLITGAGAIHSGTSVADASLEQTLVKPVVNFLILREKAKETIESVKLLCRQKHYLDCANRCYYAMMYSLKALLEHKSMLADWIPAELKEAETHGLLEQKLATLVSQNVLSSQDQSDFNYVKDQRWSCDYSLYIFGERDALTCLQKAEAFYTTVEHLTS